MENETTLLPSLSLVVGTKGYNHLYWHPITKKWNGPRADNFYDSKREDDMIDTYTMFLNSVEIKLPKVKEKAIYYYNAFPEDFVISVMVSCSSKFKEFRELWESSKPILEEFKEKLGTVTFQFPISFKCSRNNIEKLKILKKLIKESGETDESTYLSSLNCVCEFKSVSWFDKERYPNAKKKLFKGNWVMANIHIGKQYTKYHFGDLVDGMNIGYSKSDFLYFKMNGSHGIGIGTYGVDLLQKEILEMVESKENLKKVYVYFGNTDSWEPYSTAVTNSYGILEVNKYFPLSQYNVTDTQIMTPSSIFDAILLSQLI